MHTHGHDMLWRGAREGAGVDREWPGWFWSTYNGVSTEACVVAARAGYVDSLRCGVIFVADHLRHNLPAAPFVAALAEIGLTGRVHATCSESSAGPITLPHETAPGFEVAVEKAARLSRRPTMVHAQETPYRVDNVLRRTGRSTVELLDDYGLLHDQTFLVHLCEHSESDLERVAARGAWVVATPVAEMKLGERPLDPGTAARHGVKLLLGTDGPAYHNSNDLFGDLKVMALLWAREHGAQAVDAGELLSLATWRAAMAVGRPGGRIRPGEPADLVLLAADTLSLQPLVQEPFENVAVQLIYGACRADVRHVLAGGRLAVEDWQCQTVDEAEVLAAMKCAVGEHFRLHPRGSPWPES